METKGVMEVLKREWTSGVTLFLLTSIPAMAADGTAEGSDHIPLWLMILFIAGVLLGVQGLVAGRHP